MAASMKRNASLEINDEVNFKKSKLDSQTEGLASFIKWAKDNNFLLTDKVTIEKGKSCAQYGMVAVEDISEGELLFQIPRSLLISPETCAIKDSLKKECKSIQGTSGWAPLLLSLMHEYNNPSSLWRPYLDLVPDFSELDLPMFWPSGEREQLLKGSGVIEAVNKDLAGIEEEFNNVVLPFVKKYDDQFSSVCKDIEFYKKMVAFVMAYSFTEHAPEEEEVEEDSGSPPPVMVPMADILNHVAKNNAHLNFEREAFKMVTTCDIKKGEEVYNTYGELANHHLLHMYGFAEAFPLNHWDTVEIPSINLIEAAKSLDVNTEDLCKKKKDYLFSQMGLDENSGVVVGVDGVLNEEEASAILKVCCMCGDDLEERLQDKDWESDDDDEEEGSMLFETFDAVKPAWKSVLNRSAELTLGRYDNNLTEDEGRLKSTAQTTRQRYSLYTVYGQKQLLHKLIEHCS